MTFKADITPEYIVDYNVAHSLHRYGYGSKLISKFLKRSVSQIGWWLENDKMHSGIKYSKRAVNKKLNEIKHYVTEQNIGFFLVKEIQKEELNISGAYLGRFIGESKDSVNEWRKGGVPALVKEGFRDEHVIAEQYETLVTQIKYDDTKNRIMYYLAMEVYHKVKQKYPNGKIGCETISRILGEYFKKRYQ